jgi:hypothetical protein
MGCAFVLFQAMARLGKEFGRRGRRGDRSQPRTGPQLTEICNDQHGARRAPPARNMSGRPPNPPIPRGCLPRRWLARRSRVAIDWLRRALSLFCSSLRAPAGDRRAIYSWLTQEFISCPEGLGDTLQFVSKTDRLRGRGHPHRSSAGGAFQPCLQHAGPGRGDGVRRLAAAARATTHLGSEREAVWVSYRSQPWPISSFRWRTCQYG